MVEFGIFCGVCLGLLIGLLIAEQREVNDGVKEARKLAKQQRKEALRRAGNPYTEAGLRY